MATKSGRHLASLRRTVAKTATRGERVMGSLFPSQATAFAGWGNQRHEQVQHYKNWTFVAINCIWSKVASILPNLAYVSNTQKPGVTVKACQRGLMNLMGKGFGGTPAVGSAARGWDRPTLVGNDWNPQASVTGAGHSFLTVGEWKSKALSVVKPHEELEPLEAEHLLRRLIENPNPVDSSFDLIYEWGMFLELCGVSYLWAVPNEFGVPCELWVIPAHWVWPRTGGGKYVDLDANPHADELVQYYEVRPWGGMGSAGMLRLPPNEVICTRWKSPINKIDGYSKLWAVSQWIDSEEAITKSRWSQFINMARPEFWVELGPGYEDPDDDMLARMYAKIAQRHQGEGAYGRPLVTPSGAKVQVLSFSPAEMAYLESEEMIRDMILSTFGVPKSAVGVSSDMTYGSILATLTSLCEFCINPRLAMMGLSLTKHLACRWDEPGRRVKMWWDNCTPADPAQVNSDLSTDFASYAVTPNEVRVLRGRRPYRLGGNNPIVTGPAGPMPLPINEEERMDDLGELVAQYTEQAAGKKDADKLATQESNEDIPPDEVTPPEGDQETQVEHAEQVAEDGADAGVDEPNGKPSKSLVRKSWTAESLRSAAMSGALKLTDVKSAAAAVVANKSEAEIEAICDRLGVIYRKNRPQLLRAMEQVLTELVANHQRISGGPFTASNGASVFKQWCKRWVAKTDGPHEFSSTQFNLEGYERSLALTQANMIEAGDLHDKGRETTPHVTVRYGLHTSDAGLARELVEYYGPVRFVLGDVNYFPCDEYDVVVIRVDSEDLHRLNELLGELPNTQTYDEYQPHVTLAYVKPGCGEKYVGMGDRGVKGNVVEYDQLVFSPAEGVPTLIDIASYAFAEKHKGIALDTVQSAGRWLASRWENLESRYGRKGALAMALTMAATMPLPGNVAAVVAAAEAVRGLSGFWAANKDLHGHARKKGVPVNRLKWMSGGYATQVDAKTVNEQYAKYKDAYEKALGVVT